ncbi:unnamed protein product [Rotaria magnacalcarata]
MAFVYASKKERHYLRDTGYNDFYSDRKEAVGQVSRLLNGKKNKKNMFLTVTDPSRIALQILLHVNIHYTILWFILEILLYIFKYYNLPYAMNAFGTEMAIIFMLCLNEYIRQFFGMKGNLRLNNVFLIISILYGFFSIIGFIFFLVLQSYAQRVEIILSSIGLALITVEILLSIITIILNKRLMPVLSDSEKLVRLNKARKQFESSIKNE